MAVVLILMIPDALNGVEQTYSSLAVLGAWFSASQVILVVSPAKKPESTQICWICCILEYHQIRGQSKPL